jgi:hypothetical protein
MAVVFIGCRISVADLLLIFFKDQKLIGKDVKELTFETYTKENENAMYCGHLKDGMKLSDVYETIEEWDYDYHILGDVLHDIGRKYRKDDYRMLEKYVIEYHYGQKILGCKISDKLYGGKYVDIIDEKDLSKMKVEIGRKLEFYGIKDPNVGLFIFVEKRKIMVDLML